MTITLKQIETHKPEKQGNPYSKKYSIGSFEVNIDWDAFLF